MNGQGESQHGGRPGGGASTGDIASAGEGPGGFNSASGVFVRRQEEALRPIDPAPVPMGDDGDTVAGAPSAGEARPLRAVTPSAGRDIAAEAGGKPPMKPPGPQLPAVVPGSGKSGGRSSPRPEMWAGLAVVVLFFVGLGSWAALARLDAAVHAGGTIVVSGNRQAVQHREGGTISRILVRDGDKVTKDQVLVELGGSETRAREEALASQVISLEATRARLRAEMAGAREMRRPDFFAGLTGERLAMADAAFSAQQQELRTRRASIAAQKNLFEQRAAQLREQIGGFQQQVSSMGRQQELLKAEIDGIRDLNAKGFAPTTRLRALERDLARIDGSAGEYGASIARAQEAIGETRLQSISLDEQTQAEAAEQLAQIDLRLAELHPQFDAAARALVNLQMRAPVDGVVVGLAVFTEGGVARPGETLMEIVPQNRELLIEAMVRPEDADDVMPGQNTEIRVLAFSQRDMPILNGEVRQISADRFTDERTGVAYFKAIVAVPENAVAAVTSQTGDPLALRPGLPVEVIVPLRKRTALEYLIEPLQLSLWRSFREH
jgi:HlyD family secretion protein